LSLCQNLSFFRLGKSCQLGEASHSEKLAHGLQLRNGLGKHASEKHIEQVVYGERRAF